jgi:hypothetical protein
VLLERVLVAIVVGKKMRVCVFELLQLGDDVQALRPVRQLRQLARHAPAAGNVFDVRHPPGRRAP